MYLYVLTAMKIATTPMIVAKTQLMMAIMSDLLCPEVELDAEFVDAAFVDAKFVDTEFVDAKIVDAKFVDVGEVGLDVRAKLEAIAEGKRERSSSFHFTAIPPARTTVYGETPTATVPEPKSGSVIAVVGVRIELWQPWGR